MHTATIEATDVNNALAQGLSLVTGPTTILEPSRNGAVLVNPGPVVTTYVAPLRRVLLCPLRNANPFFHLFESLWMLGGRNDLPWVAQFNKRMASYSDDGGATQPAAYGHRWRKHFGYDQLDVIAEELRRNPSSRRCVLSMWDAASGTREWPDDYTPKGGFAVAVGDLFDAVNGSADVPCNTHCYFTIRDGELHMAVMCRSNDILWGAYGANAVHFSILLEYMAAKVGVGVGTMTQFSWNFHLYDGVLKHDVRKVIDSCHMASEYVSALLPTHVVQPSNVELFDRELPLFLDFASRGNALRRELVTAPALEHTFLVGTALPMLRAWDCGVQSPSNAVHLAREIQGADWRAACVEWLTRKHERRMAKWGEKK